jgi:hypothetical protein
MNNLIVIFIWLLGLLGGVSAFQARLLRQIVTRRPGSGKLLLAARPDEASTRGFGKKIVSKVAPALTGIALFFNGPMDSHAQMATTTRRSTQRRSSARSRRKNAKRRAAVEIEVAETKPSEDGTSMTSVNVAKPSNNISLKQVGIVFMAATVVNKIIFRDSSKKGKKKNTRDPNYIPQLKNSKFESQSLSLEKGQLKAIMSKLDDTLAKKASKRSINKSQRLNKNKNNISKNFKTVDINDGEDNFDINTDIESEGSQNEDDDLFDEISNANIIPSTSLPRSSRRRSTLSSKFSATSLPSQDDFFANSPDDLFTSNIDSTAVDNNNDSNYSNTRDDSSMFEDNDGDMDIDDNDNDTLLATTVSTSKEEKKAGLLGRMFRKSGEGRPTDLSSVLLTEGEPEERQLFKAAVARALLSYVPPDLNPELRSELGGNISIEDAKELLLRAKLAAELDAQSAAESFADVANCVIVALIDRATTVTGKGQDAEDERVVALDVVVSTMNLMGELFECIASGAQIEPIVYNGKTRKGKIEDLYYTYAKTAMSLSGMLSAMGMGGVDTSKQSDSDNSDTNDNKIDSEERMKRLGQLQVVFSIRDKKKIDLENKIMRNMMMNMMKGDTDINLENLLGGLGEGLGGDGDISKLLEGLGGDMSNIDLDALKDMDMSDMGLSDNMSPEEMAKMSADAMGAVKQSIEDGTIGKSDVEELEKMMGGDIDQLLNMITQGNVDKKKLAELGPDFQDLVSVFKELSAIKKRK